MVGRELDVRVVADDDHVLVIAQGADEIADPLLGTAAPVARDDMQHAQRAR
jgi:hypothetical protein